MRSTGVPFLLTVFIHIYTVQGSLRPQHDKVVACYVSSWAAYRPEDGKFELGNIRPELCTHLIYAFAGLDANTSTIKSLDPWADLEDNSGKGNYRKMTALRYKHPGLKVTLGIGGWNELSADYSALAAAPPRRRIFVSSVVEFLRKFDFDGLDLDWEYPTKRGGAPYDKENFISLIKELKDAFINKGLLLTAAIGANTRMMDEAYGIPEISKYLDYIHVMAYDYHGAWDKQVLPNAPLRSNDGLNVIDTITHLLNKGAPPKKLVLGIPTYGRTFILSAHPNSTVNPLGLTTIERGFQGRYTREDGFMGYNEICKELVDDPKNWRTGWDEYTNSAYAIRDDNVIMYDNPRSVKAKVEYIQKLNLAGVMVWTLDTDDFRGYCSSLHADILDSFAGRDYPIMKVINMALVKESNVPTDNSVTSKPGKSSAAGAAYFNVLIIFVALFVSI